MALCCLKRGKFGFCSLSENRISQTHSALLLGLKFFHLRMESLAYNHLIFSWVSVKWVSAVILSFSSHLLSLFCLWKRWVRWEGVKNLCRHEKKRTFCPGCIHIVKWENVCYCWVFSLLRQSIKHNCEGGYCYTDGYVSTYSHKCHGLEKTKCH